MSQAREIGNPLIRPAANAVHALQGRLRSWLGNEADLGNRSAQESAEGRHAEANSRQKSMNIIANSVVRIASIDLDYDPWWLYFRRRR